MKTFTATPSTTTHKWFVVDADGQVLGRLASEIAKILRGKHKPIFTPHMDTGDFVIVVNASKVVVTGRKAEQKQYFNHTGYMGHERYTPFSTMMARHPERVIEIAVVIGERGEVIDRHSWLFNPERPISKESTEVHGIRDEDVRDKPVFGAA